MRELILSVGVAIGVMACVFIPLFVLGAAGEAAGCSATARKMQLEHSYGVMQGCMVNVHGQWYPIDAVQYTNGRMEISNVQ